MSADDTPEALFDRLVAADVLVERDGDVRRTDGFESTLDITRATYADTESAFRDAFAATFDLDPAAAADRIEANGVTREEFAVLKALQHHLEESDPDALLRMAGMATAAGPTSPVPESVTELPEPAGEVLADTDALLFVFKRDCEPCERLRAELEEVLEAVPAEVAVFGIDGPERSAVLERYEVAAAPTALLFRDGEEVGRIEGYQPVAAFRAAFREAFAERA